MTEGDREGAQSGFYVGHMDGRPAGYIKNNRTGEELRWKSQGAFLNNQDRAAFLAECEKKKAERISVNPTTKQRMLVPPKLVLTYKPSTLLKDKFK